MPHVPLRAVLDGNGNVQIQGNGGAQLGRGSGAHVFTFALDDQTSLGVTFRDPAQGMIQAEDNGAGCPPASNNSTQIDNVRRPTPTTAQFRDKNDNQQVDMPVSYMLHFDCAGDGNQNPTFDPIIINGGN